VRLDDCAALATAGSGDVLAGVIGACVARGAEAWTAAIAGAAAHVAAGRAAAAARPGGAIIAGDLIEHLRVLARPGSTL
jgi:NAD(P)H-hydrate repair Nnr-like enzyme with NAD(P)H-hydrate dehydratase domain